MTSPLPFSRADAITRDLANPLRAFRERFHLHPGTIYMDGNSLGPLSHDAEEAILAAVQSWKTHGIDGWTQGERPWFWLGEDLGAKQSDLVGALPDEVVVTGSTTVNLHALVSTFYRPEGNRRRILADDQNFPSDLYGLKSQIALRGHDPATDLVIVPSRDGRIVEEDDIIFSMSDDIAFAWFSAVNYRSGQLFDIERLTREAHARGILIGFDLAHSAGVVPHRLHDWGVDAATWCTYKYLNGGPGAVGALFVHQRHFGTTPALAGWWGYAKDRQFDMSPDFSAATSAGAWQIGTPSVLGAAALHGSLAITAEAGIDVIRAVSLALTGYLIDLVDARLADLGFSIGTPRDPARRGGHIAIEHPDGARLARALKARGVVPDFRPPTTVRFSPVALYTTYADVWDAIEILHDLASTGAHLEFENERGVVA